MEFANLTPALLLAPFFLLVMALCIFVAPDFVVIGAVVLWGVRAYRRRKHRFDPFVEAMLK